MKDLYLSSTFTDPWNVGFNKKLGPVLEGLGLNCYLPHRDTNQQGPKDNIFTEDVAGIKNSKSILAIAKNESPNFGAEIGFAHGLDIPIIAIAEIGHNIPLICRKMCREIIVVENLDNIEMYIDEVVGVIKKVI